MSLSQCVVPNPLECPLSQTFSMLYYQALVKHILNSTLKFPNIKYLRMDFEKKKHTASKNCEYDGSGAAIINTTHDIQCLV